MVKINFSKVRLGIALVAVCSLFTSCLTSAKGRYFGQTNAPTDNILRYVTGSEPESLDPQFGTGQPEARIYIALYDGLVEYHPKTMEPIPAIAESWEINNDGTEYLFHLRKNAKFSDGVPITARDFVYTFRRGLSPELAARNGILGYYIKYAEAYNSAQSFVRDANGSFLLKKDFADVAEDKKAANPTAEAPVTGKDYNTAASARRSNHSARTPSFTVLSTTPERLYVPTDEKERAKDFRKKCETESRRSKASSLSRSKPKMSVSKRLTITLFASNFTSPRRFSWDLLAHQFFRAVPQHVIEKHGKAWERA